MIDIHQHIVYNDRTVEQLIAHQRTMGVTTTVLLPTGDRGEGHPGGSGDHEAVLELCRTHPGEFVFFANEISDHAEAPKIIERQLRRGAIGIGEQKFRVDCDSPHIERIAEVARSFGVPVLMHFEHGRYNRHIERFHLMLERFPTVNFIGHAQAWWGNIHKNHEQTNNYPRGSVTPGGITDRYLSDYSNCFADLSAGSGYNAITRDEDKELRARDQQCGLKHWRFEYIDLSYEEPTHCLVWTPVCCADRSIDGGLSFFQCPSALDWHRSRDRTCGVQSWSKKAPSFIPP